MPIKGVQVYYDKEGRPSVAIIERKKNAGAWRLFQEMIEAEEQLQKLRGAAKRVADKVNQENVNKK